MSLFVFLFLPFAQLHFAHASDLETVVVTATRTNSNGANIASDYSILQGEEVRSSGGTDLTNALNSLPGLHMSSTGGAGQPKSLSIRGAQSENTLVLVDGVAVNDPLSPARGFDFANFPLDSIERVEVIRGPESVLYGSDALGGVVNIITKSGSKKAELNLSGGSYGTAQGNFSAAGFSSSFLESKGFSAADERLGNKEADGYKRYSFAGDKEYSLGENTNLRLKGTYINSRADTDSRGGSGGDSFNTVATDSQFILLTKLTNFSINDTLQSTAALSFSSHDRTDSTSGNSFYNGNVMKASLQEDYSALKQHLLTFGLEAQNERGFSSDFADPKSAAMLSAFVQDQWSPGRFFATLGAREDYHPLYGSAPTFRSATGYWIIPESLKWKASFGTGFKAPSLYQNYSSFGSTALQPSKSYSWDTGLEENWTHWHLELNYFQSRFHNLIDFNSATSKYSNISASESDGEEFVSGFLDGFWDLKNSITLLRSYDRNTGLLLLRKPRVTDSFTIGIQPGEQTKIASNWQYIGAREDADPITGARVRMPSYLLVGLSAEQKLKSDLALTLHVDNLLDHIYEDVRGFGTARFSVYLGLKSEL